MRSLSYYGFKRKRGDGDTCEYVHDQFVRGDRAAAAAIPRLSKDEKKDKQRERLHPHPQIQPAYPPQQKQYAPPLDDTGVPPPRVTGQGQIGLLVGGSEAESEADEEDEAAGARTGTGASGAHTHGQGRGGSQDGGAAAMPPSKRPKSDTDGRPLVLGPHARLYGQGGAGGGHVQQALAGGANEGHPMTVMTAHSHAGASGSSSGEGLPGVHAAGPAHAGSLGHAQSGGAEGGHGGGNGVGGRQGRAWPVNASGVASYYAGPVLARMDSLARKASSGVPSSSAAGSYQPLPSPTYEGHLSGTAPDSGAAFLPAAYGQQGGQAGSGAARSSMALAPYQLQRIPSHNPGEGLDVGQGPVSMSVGGASGRAVIDTRSLSITADGLCDPAVALNVSPHLSYHGPATSLVGGSSSLVSSAYSRRLPSPANGGAPSVLGLGPLGVGGMGVDSAAAGAIGASSIIMSAGGVAEGFRADRGPGTRGSGMAPVPGAPPSRVNSVGLTTNVGVGSLTGTSSAQPPAPLRMHASVAGVALMPYSELGSGAGALSLLAAGAEESAAQHTAGSAQAAAQGGGSRMSKNVLHDGVPTSAIHDAGTPHPLNVSGASSAVGGGGVTSMGGGPGRADMGLLAGAASPLAGSASGGAASMSLYPTLQGKRSSGGAQGGAVGGSSRPTSARMGASVPADLLAGTPLPESSPPGPGMSSFTGRGRGGPAGMMPSGPTLPAPPAPAPTSQVLPMPASSGKGSARKDAGRESAGHSGGNGLRIATPKEEETAGQGVLEGPGTRGPSQIEPTGGQGSTSSGTLDDSLQMSPLGGL